MTSINNEGLTIISYDTELVTEIPLRKFNMIRNKEQVFEGNWYTTDIFTETSSNGDTVMLHHNLTESELTLDEYRFFGRNEMEIKERRNNIMYSFLATMYLVSQGKLYNILLHPSNFVYDTDTGYVKGFYREPYSLEQLDNKWELDVRKLLGYYLTDNVNLTADVYESSSIHTIMEFMDDSVRVLYKKLLEIETIEELTEIALESSGTFDFSDIKDLIPFISGNKRVNDIRTSQEDISENIIIESPLTETSDRENERQRNTRPERQPKPKKVKKEKSSHSGSLSKTILTVLISVVIGAGGYYFIEKNNILGKESEEIVSAQEDTDYYMGILESSLQDYEKANEYFTKYLSKEDGSKNLTEDEKSAIFLSYLLADEYENALNIVPTEENAELVINYLSTKKKLEEELPSLSSDLVPIKFEQAVISKSYEDIVSLMDKINYIENTVRQNRIVEALTKTDNIEDAVHFADSLESKELLGAIKSWSYEEIDRLTESKDKKDEMKRDITKRMKETLKNSSNLSEKDID